MSLDIAYTVKEVTRQYLAALTSILTQAKVHAAATGAAERAFLEARLYPDMKPMIWQVQMASEFCARCASRLVGDELPSFPFEEKSFDELIARLERAMSHIDQIDDAALSVSGEQVLQIPFGPGVTLELTGQDYVLKLFLPNFFFHVTTAYNLLRHNGVPLGKKDFVGNF
ncbi:MAG: DUF1993 domain-containing protein [Cyanobacteria bacterium P01_A01_bin.17]